VEHVNELTQSSASSAEEMSSATEELSGMAQDLQRLVGQFKIVDDDRGKGTLPAPIVILGRVSAKGQPDAKASA